MAITQERKMKLSKNIACTKLTLVHQSTNRCFNSRNRALNEHLREHKRPPFTSWIIKMVGRRRHLLNYLRGKDIQRYRELIKSLGIRR